MIVGAISDTHDNLEQVDKAMVLFRERKVDALVHCGDFITPIVYDHLSVLRVPFYGVFGNNDYEEALGLRSHQQIHKEPYRFFLGGKTFSICHKRSLAESEERSGAADVVVFGETHAPEVRRAGTCLIVNPGENCGWVHGRSTVAIIDVGRMEAEILELAQ